MRKISTLLIAAACITALSSCNSQKKALTATPDPSLSDAAHTVKPGIVHDNNHQPATPVNTAPGVLNGEWVVLDIGGEAVTPAPEQDNSVTITLNLNHAGEGALYCHTGCNYVNGSVIFSPSAGTVTTTGSYISTLKACDDASMAVEQRLLSALDNVKAYKVEHINGAYFLYLNDASGKTLITTRRWDNNFLNGAWNVTQVGDMRVGDDSEARLVFDINEERIHGNTGCNIINGTLRLIDTRINGLEFTDLATTRMACPEPVMALEQAMLLALEEVTSCQAEADGNTAVLKNADDKAVIKLRRMTINR